MSVEGNFYQRPRRRGAPAKDGNPIVAFRLPRQQYLDKQAEAMRRGMSIGILARATFTAQELPLIPSTPAFSDSPQSAGPPTVHHYHPPHQPGVQVAPRLQDLLRPQPGPAAPRPETPKGQPTQGTRFSDRPKRY